MEIKEKIIKWCGQNKLAFCSGSYFLLDYSECGNEVNLHSGLNLLERLIEKHFNITYRASYLGIRELQYK